MKLPKWTVFYNTVVAESSWIGTGYEFFNNEQAARERQRSIPTSRDAAGESYCGPVCATSRPFHPVDIPFLGVCDRADINSKPLEEMTEVELSQLMNTVGSAASRSLPPKTLFVVLAFPQSGLAQHVSNANRQDIIAALRETATRLELRQDNPR